MELDGHSVADLDLGGVAEDLAGGVGGDGVAAFENAKGAAFFKLEGEALEAFALGAKQAFGADAKLGRAFLETQAERSDFHAKIERSDAQMRGSKAPAGLLQPPAQVQSKS